MLQSHTPHRSVHTAALIKWLCVAVLVQHDHQHTYKRDSVERREILREDKIYKNKARCCAHTCSLLRERGSIVDTCISVHSQESHPLALKVWERGRHQYKWTRATPFFVFPEYECGVESIATLFMFAAFCLALRMRERLGGKSSALARRGRVLLHNFPEPGRFLLFLIRSVSARVQ